MMGVMKRRVGRPNLAAGVLLARPRTRPSANRGAARRSVTGALGVAHAQRRRSRAAHAGTRPFRQRRVTFAGPQLPRTSTARTRTATFAARLRTGRTMPAFGVCSVAIFHGPLFTEYWTR